MDEKHHDSQGEGGITSTSGMPTPPSSPHPSPLRVLVVEDELMIAWLAIDTIHQLGHKVCATVSTPEDAIDAAIRLAPDVVLMDYRLAGRGNGLTAARRIHQVAPVPIIFCTAYPGHLEAALAVSDKVLGETSLIAKPIEAACLKKVLDRLFRLSSSLPPSPPAGETDAG
jgi:CheY-like chemotaxis protein